MRKLYLRSFLKHNHSASLFNVSRTHKQACHKTVYIVFKHRISYKLSFDIICYRLVY